MAEVEGMFQQDRAENVGLGKRKGERAIPRRFVLSLSLSLSSKIVPLRSLARFSPEKVEKRNRRCWMDYRYDGRSSR